MTSSITSALLQAAGQRDRILDCARRLIAVQSPNPPGDTHAVAAMAAELIRALAPSAAAVSYTHLPPRLGPAGKARADAPPQGVHHHAARDQGAARAHQGGPRLARPRCV